MGRTHNYLRPPGGRRWSQIRLIVLATYGGICHLCQHPGAQQVDHLIPVSLRPDLGWVVSNLRPAHGGKNNPCPVCHLRCNQVRGTKALDAFDVTSAVPKPRKPPASRGRKW
jgi:5-methylcytosine-specific restriction endonuclease McrA